MTAQHIQPVLENIKMPFKEPVVQKYTAKKQLILHFIQEEIAFLKDNWDGYGASPIEEKVMYNLIYLINNLPVNLVNSLDKDTILPNSNGTISLECISNNNELFLEVGNDYSTYYIKKNGEVNKINNQFILSNDLEFRQFVKDLNAL